MGNGGIIGAPNIPTGVSAKGVWTMDEMRFWQAQWKWPSKYSDTFDVDSTGSYTQYSDSAGTWSIASGELTATGGSQSVFIRNGTSFTDVKIECDINQARDAGLVVRFIDNSNYYVLVLSDDAGAASAQNLSIYKRSAGSLTQLAWADMTWVRGVSKKIRFAVVGTTLSAMVDGVSVLSVTDSTHAGPGGVGMRNNSATPAKYQAFRWDL